MQNSKRNITSGCTSKFQGYSYPLCTKIVESLRKRQEKFHIQTLFILGHNTKMDYEGNMRPLFAGLLVNFQLVELHNTFMEEYIYIFF